MISAIPCFASFDVQWHGETSSTSISRKNFPTAIPSLALEMWKPPATANILFTPETFCARLRMLMIPG